MFLLTHLVINKVLWEKRRLQGWRHSEALRRKRRMKRDKKRNMEKNKGMGKKKEQVLIKMFPSSFCPFPSAFLRLSPTLTPYSHLNFFPLSFPFCLPEAFPYSHPSQPLEHFPFVLSLLPSWGFTLLSPLTATWTFSLCPFPSAILRLYPTLTPHSHLNITILKKPETTANTNIQTVYFYRCRYLEVEENLLH